MPEPEQAISATASCSIFIVGLLGCGLVSCVEECSETEIETTSPSPMCINRPRSDLSKSEGRVDGRSRADAYVLPESKSVGGLFSSVVCILDVVDVDRHEASARKKAESVRGTSREVPGEVGQGKYRQ